MLDVLSSIIAHWWAIPAFFAVSFLFVLVLLIVLVAVGGNRIDE